MCWFYVTFLVFWSPWCSPVGICLSHQSRITLSKMIVLIVIKLFCCDLTFVVDTSPSKGRAMSSPGTGRACPTHAISFSGFDVYLVLACTRLSSCRPSSTYSAAATSPSSLPRWAWYALVSQFATVEYNLDTDDNIVRFQLVFRRLNKTRHCARVRAFVNPLLKKNQFAHGSSSQHPLAR